MNPLSVVFQKLNTKRITYLSKRETEKLYPISLYKADKNILDSIEHQLIQILNKNILPFWYPKVIDLEDGGYLLNHDIKGIWKGKTSKSIVAQTRTMWFFSRLAQTEYGTSEHLNAAKHGYNFIKDRMWDKQFGGFYWEVDSTAENIIKPDKHLYGQAFGLFALSEYVKATGDNKAIELACNLFNIIDNHCHDKEFGGYCEFHNRDWSIKPANIINYMNVKSNIKQLNTHLHLLEALTDFYLIKKETKVRERLIELIIILSNSVLRKTAGACTDQHLFNWIPIYETDINFVNYGHEIENIWLLIEATNAVNFPNSLLMDLYRTLFYNSFRYGFDKKNGGFYYGGFLRSPAYKLGKIWWVQAEGLISSLYLYKLTNEKFYFDCFLRILEWIIKWQTDWEFGDWYSTINKNGKPKGDKASNANGAWKTPYHNGRAIIKCLELIHSFDET